MRALVLDDSLVMRMIVEQALRQCLPELDEVLQAGNGVQGLHALDDAAAAGKEVDLVLCDVHMPVMDGLAFLRAMRERELAPGVPVVLITAEGSDPELLAALRADDVRYISKPFTLEQMHTLVASMLLSVA